MISSTGQWMKRKAEKVYYKSKIPKPDSAWGFFYV